MCCVSPPDKGIVYALNVAILSSRSEDRRPVTMPSEAQVTKSAIDRLKSAIQAKRKADKALVSSSASPFVGEAINGISRLRVWSSVFLSESTRTVYRTLRR